MEPVTLLTGAKLSIECPMCACVIKLVVLREENVEYENDDETELS